MARKPNIERNKNLISDLNSGMKRGQAAEKYGLSYAHTFRILPAAASGKGVRSRSTGTRDATTSASKAEQFDSMGRVNPPNSQIPDTQPGMGPDYTGKDAARYVKAGGDLFTEITSTGLRRFANRVLDDYDRVFTSVRQRVELFREMGDDPSVAVVLNAFKFTLRNVEWYVDTDGETDIDKEAKEFLETCMDDMSNSWTDTMDQAVNCIQYGFYPAELVYKRRAGPDPGKIKVKNLRGEEIEQEAPSSKFDDHKIGWRRWTFMAPESLAPGREWEFDDAGGIHMIYQLPPPDYRMRSLPMDKAILFRTNVEKGNPEGKSLLRPMWAAYWFKHNLEEIEAIAAERMGAGLPIAYLGKDVSKNLSDANSDAANIKTLVTNIRTDEQMGVVIPYAKMGGGAMPGEGVLVELLSPPSRGVVNFDQTITRYEQRIAMIGLAQFLHLGMSNVGARALGETSQDFFSMAVDGWADQLADTINRYAVDRLFRINAFPGLTNIPYITHQNIRGASLEQLADFVNKLMQVQALTPGPELEEYLRSAANLPHMTPIIPGEAVDKEQEATDGGQAAPDTRTRTSAGKRGPAATGDSTTKPADAEKEDTSIHDMPAGKKSKQANESRPGAGMEEDSISSGRAEAFSLARAAEHLADQIEMARRDLHAESAPAAPIAAPVSNVTLHSR